MSEAVPQFETSPERVEPLMPRGVMKMRVKTASISSDPELVVAVRASPDYNGDGTPALTTTEREYAVYVAGAKAVGDIVYAIAVEGGTHKLVSSKRVGLRELAGGTATLPAPQYPLMVYQGVAPNVGGFDWVRYAPLAEPAAP